MEGLSLGLQRVCVCVCASVFEQRAACVRGLLTAALTVMIFQRLRGVCVCVCICMMLSLEGK